MDLTADRPAVRLATRLSFFAAGFIIAVWAALVPFAKSHVGADEGQFGLLLLCLGIGSIISMPVTGYLSGRYGCRPFVLIGGAGVVVLLPMLMLMHTPLMLGATLLVFGLFMGSLDLSMNVHAIEAERLEDRPVMSGFHALFSIGGFCGAAGATMLLSFGMRPLETAICGAVVVAAALWVCGPRLLRARGEEPPPFTFPRGTVLLLALMAGTCFLIEGAVLDWGALLIVGQGMVGSEQGGIAYMLFASAMTVGRLVGDRVVAIAGDRRTLVWGGLITCAGTVVLITVPWPPAALCGFVLIGLGSSNLVPVLFSLSGRQPTMAPALALSAVSTTGFAGVLMGPAAIGFVAHATSLPIAFGIIALLFLIIPLSARFVVPKAL